MHKQSEESLSEVVSVCVRGSHNDTHLQVEQREGRMPSESGACTKLQQGSRGAVQWHHVSAQLLLCCIESLPLHTCKGGMHSTSAAQITQNQTTCACGEGTCYGEMTRHAMREVLV